MAFTRDLRLTEGRDFFFSSFVTNLRRNGIRRHKREETLSLESEITSRRYNRIT